MNKIKTGVQLAKAMLEVAEKYQTLYVNGCCGAPLTEANKKRYIAAQSFNRKTARQAKINAATKQVFGFDCVCVIKSLLWGWKGDNSKSYGGATYLANGVPDVDADYMIKLCKDVSKDFTNIQVGEAVWIKGHIGIYVGYGKVVECTYNWKDGVQITAAHNFGKIAGMNGRTWVKHGKLPWLTYEEAVPELDTKAESEPDYALGMRILREGCTGEDVRALQILLNGRGCSCGNADGIYGKKTGDAVEAYQGKKNLSKDRIAGHDTMSHLMGIK